MTIKYKSNKIYVNLALGVIWLLLGVISLWQDDGRYWNNYIYLFLGILYFGIYIIQTKRQYITIENGVIRDNNLFGKTLREEELTETKEFAGEYIFRSGKKEIRINTDVIDEESKVKLEQYYSNLKQQSAQL